MTELFFTVLTLSAQGLAAALVAGAAVLLLRRTRCAKTALLLLWAVVGLRLVCPWSPPSPFSLFNLAQPVERTVRVERETQSFPAADSGVPLTPGDLTSGDVSAPSASLSENRVPAAAENAPAPVQRGLWETYSPALAWVWLGGAAACFAWGVVSYLSLKRRLRFAVRDDTLPGVWYSDRIQSPCVAGLLRPQIYLTFGMSEDERDYVLAHERQHIRSGDHIWKVAGWLIMCVHWFNPLLWLVFFRGLQWTLEEACDQRVLRQLGEENKKAYSLALLSLSAGRRFTPGPSPIAFGEGETKGRVRSVLKYKKPLAGATAAALLLAAVAGATLLTGRAEGDNGTDATPGEDDGVYQVTDVIHQTNLSSMTSDYFLTKCGGTQVVFTPERFCFEYGSVDLKDPIYEEMTLGDSLYFMDTGNEEFDRTMCIDLSIYDSVQGWRVLRSSGTFSGYHVFLLDGRLWIGQWNTYGTERTISEYWYILEAARPSANGTQYGILSNVAVYYNDVLFRSAVFPALPFSFDLTYDELTAVCAGGQLAQCTPGAAPNGADMFDAYAQPGTSITIKPGQTLHWSPHGAPKKSVIDLAFYKDGEQFLTAAIVIQPGVTTQTDIEYYARASVSDEGYRFYSADDVGVFTDKPLYETAASYEFFAVVDEVRDNALVVSPLQNLKDGAEQILIPWEVSPDGDPVYSRDSLVVVEARGAVAINSGGEPATVDEVLSMFPLSAPVAYWEADLTHDGIPEYITVHDTGAGLYQLLVTQGTPHSRIHPITKQTGFTIGSQVLWSGEASTSHAGQIGYYLCETDGEQYLMQWTPYMISGTGSYEYRLFYLDEEQGEMECVSNTAEFSLDDPMAVDVEFLRTLETEVTRLLEHSQVLLSTNGDTPEGVWYGDGENPVKPIINQSMYYEPVFLADYFEALQAEVQGTYTFTGTVVSVDDSTAMIENETLWKDRVEQSIVFTVPLYGQPKLAEGDRVEVTADGPLYRWNLPSAETSIEVKVLGDTPSAEG